MLVYYNKFLNSDNSDVFLTYLKDGLSSHKENAPQKPSK